MRKSSYVKSLGLVLVFVVSGGLPKMVTSEAQPSFQTEPMVLYSATELKAGTNGHYIVKADINNTSVTVLVDTGATTVALSYEDAESVGLHPSQLDYTMSTSTANGIAKVAPVILKKIIVDGVRVDNVQAVVMSRGAMNGTLLGMSFLSKLKSFKVENGTLYLKE